MIGDLVRRTPDTNAYAEMEIPKILREFDLLWVRNTEVAVSISLSWYNPGAILQFDSFVLEFKQQVLDPEEEDFDSIPAAIVVHENPTEFRFRNPLTYEEYDRLVHRGRSYDSIIAFLPLSESREISRKIRSLYDESNPNYGFEEF